ncbi:hypothetical protein BKE38_22215 [Pseudoroseomonas deserti]|uniref:Uncharacterized protein n=2 Tax=Teichococcus deserti TaxID=1817963 RepID=A0A1V2GYW3_9PROT|nr:hypothetical protein BKE38_22215 [Pseudoroseomonas deserti]
MLAVLALCAATPAPAATPQEFGGMRFEIAEGWTRRDARDGVILQRSYVTTDSRGRRKTGTALIQLSVAKPAQGAPLPAAFAQFIAAGLPELTRERPLIKGQGITTNGHAIIFEERCCGRRNDVSLSGNFVGIGTPAGYHFSQLVMMNMERDQRREAEAQYEAMIRSLLLAPDDEPFRLTPPRGAGGLDGIYSYLDTGIRPNAFGGTDFYADNNITVFDPSGLYSTEIPKDGMTLQAHCAATPSDCGFYRLAGSQIERLEVRRGYGVLERDSDDFARNGDDLKIGSRDYRRIPPIPAGTRLSGTWRYFFASVGTGAFSSGSVAVERHLQLTPDGRFTRSGFSGASMTNSIGGSTTGVTTGSDRPVTAGRYEIDGYRLTLIGDDGAREVQSIFMADRGSDGLLVINGNNYLKQEPEGQRSSRRR